MCHFAVNEINNNIRRFIIKNQQSNSIENLDDDVVIASKEIFKFLMSQITSLRKLNISRRNLFITYSGAIDCLKNLSELYCHSDILS